MGLLRRLRDRVGPTIGIGESRETRAEKTVRKYLDAVTEARAALKDIDVTAASHIAEARKAADQARDYNTAIRKTASDLRVVISPMTEGDRLKAGDLTSRHGDNAELATEEAQKRIGHAEEQIRLNQKLFDHHAASLASAGVSAEEALRRTGSTPFSKISEGLVAQESEITQMAAQEIYGRRLSELRNEAESVLAGHDLAKRMFADAEDQHRFCLGMEERLREQFDAQVGVLVYDHDSTLVSRYTEAQSRDAALSEISEWEKQIRRVKSAMSAEFDIAELPDPMQVYEATPEGPEGWPKDMPGVAKEESAEALYPDSPDGIEGAPKEMPSM